MDWNVIFELIDPALIVVVAVCWVIGFALKHTPSVPSWTIIFIVTAIAIVFTTSILGLSAESVIQGILCGAVAVFGHQTVKQAKKGGAKND
ncbi:phage holin family protein [Paenibacillus alvei]|uniref:Phage holin family protein n=1 Tax=Paenibacillus alvei TaxID=44250 RepID=A0ABT4GX21_PAEAL|nr:phage holin family protein [Paenibacillus alvei]MCY9734616.1 phage holin family protein [Paenibacillus alvei]MCY9755366.1 phage holin family protein [Paenibacillus alvei]MCY9761258.1 phage holin family protein [Paenibacillus alvei]MCY9765697.1 phage holin family protein [Paenibacillus alvei]